MKKSLVVAAFAVAACGSPAAAQDDRGAYLVSIMDCSGCHTPGALIGAPDMDRALSGGDVGFEIPALGIFYPPNLTSDASGAGSWTADEIIAAVTKGVRPDGRQLAPVMPYHAYAALTSDDAQALAQYLKKTAPIANQVPDPVGPGEAPPLPYLTVRMPQ